MGTRQTKYLVSPLEALDTPLDNHPKQCEYSVRMLPAKKEVGFQKVMT